jgi:hypothetical protein
LHNKPLGCDASVAGAAGPFTLPPPRKGCGVTDDSVSVKRKWEIGRETGEGTRKRKINKRRKKQKKENKQKDKR